MLNIDKLKYDYMLPKKEYFLEMLNNCIKFKSIEPPYSFYWLKESKLAMRLDKDDKELWCNYNYFEPFLDEFNITKNEACEIIKIIMKQHFNAILEVYLVMMNNN